MKNDAQYKWPELQRISKAKVHIKAVPGLVISNNKDINTGKSQWVVNRNLEAAFLPIKWGRDVHTV